MTVQTQVTTGKLSTVVVVAKTVVPGLMKTQHNTAGTKSQCQC